jgi:hypothetical protein
MKTGLEPTTLYLFSFRTELACVRLNKYVSNSYYQVLISGSEDHIAGKELIASIADLEPIAGTR